MREKLDLLGAMEALKEGLTIEPSNEAMQKTMEEISVEVEQDNSIPADHPEKKRFDRLI